MFFQVLSIFTWYATDQRSFNEWLWFKLHWYESNTGTVFHSIWLLSTGVNLISWIDEIPILFLNFTLSRSEGNKPCCLLISSSVYTLRCFSPTERNSITSDTQKITLLDGNNSIISIILNSSSNTIHWPFSMSWFCENSIEVNVIFYSKPFSKESIVLIAVLACWVVRYCIQIFQLFQVKWLKEPF